MEDAHGSSGTVQQLGAGGPPTIDVKNTAELIDALDRAKADFTIRLKKGKYEVNKTLMVPDGVTLQGAGVMLLNDQGLPVQFESETTSTTITANPNLKGNLVSLGNQSSLRRLVLQGAGSVREDAAGLGGNVVAVASRDRDDIVSATIDECELINKITSDVGTDGPTGGAILAYTRNPRRGDAPPPHVDAEVTLALTRSIVRTPNEGKAVFAMNFASRGKVTHPTEKERDWRAPGPLAIERPLDRDSLERMQGFLSNLEEKASAGNARPFAYMRDVFGRPG